MLHETGEGMLACRHQDVANLVSDHVAEDVADIGLCQLTVQGPWSIGANAGIVVDVERRVLSAGADVRTDAYAWAR